MLQKTESYVFYMHYLLIQISSTCHVSFYLEVETIYMLGSMLIP